MEHCSIGRYARHYLSIALTAITTAACDAPSDDDLDAARMIELGATGIEPITGTDSSTGGASGNDSDASGDSGTGGGSWTGGSTTIDPSGGGSWGTGGASWTGGSTTIDPSGGGSWTGDGTGGDASGDGGSDDGDDDDDEDEVNYCHHFPPNASGDDNANDDDCELPDGNTTAYCHLHLCDDLPGGPNPQLHCKVPGDEHELSIPVTGSGLDCTGVVTTQTPTCNEEYGGIEVILPLPAQDDACTCCVVPDTGTADPNTDCSDGDNHCVKVYYGEQCGVPSLATTAALDILCSGLENELPCMQKTCRYQGNQYYREYREEEGDRYVPYT